MSKQNRRNIILTGFMGTGKSTIGRLLAEYLDTSFVDTDTLIESRHNEPVASIFARLGEAAFRQMERDIAIELGQQTRLVIATGGGLLLDPENVNALSSGCIVCLTATPDDILIRVTRNGRISRPLLNVDDPRQRILDLLDARNKHYAQFPQVSTHNKLPTAIAADVLKVCKP